MMVFPARVAAFFGVALALAMPGPAQAQQADPVACYCLKQSVDRLGADMTAAVTALADAKAEFARLSADLQAARTRLDVNNPQAVAEFRQLLAQRDEASRRAEGEVLAQSVAATDQYNAAVAEYNGRCAGQPLRQLSTPPVCPGAR
jgi:hypothetical protein